MSKRHEWFIKGDWPSYVIWWVDDEHIPTWQEACQHYDKLYNEGPTLDAFDFKHSLGPDGQPVKIDREVIRQKIAQRQRMTVP